MPKRNFTSHISPESDSHKSGWRVREWGDAVGLSRSSTFNLLKAGRLKFVKFGRSTIITTGPAEFLAGLGDQ
jgi:hypothetical protein